MDGIKGIAKWRTTYFFILFGNIILSKSARLVSSGDLAEGWNSRGSQGFTQQFLSTQRSLPVVRIDSQGKTFPTQITKQQLANELRLPLRDLRIVDPSFPTQIQAAFMARTKSILFCIENIKVVIKHDEAVIFSPYQKEVVDFIPALQQQISQSLESSPNGLILRFEHVVLEAALSIVCNNLNRKVRTLAPAVATTLNALRIESRGLDLLQQTQVDELLPLKNKLDELRKRVKEIKRAINDILNNDEDMLMMHLGPDSNSIAPSAPTDNGLVAPIEESTGHGSGVARSSVPGTALISSSSSTPSERSAAPGSPTSGIDTMDLEMLFENYLMQLEWINSDIEDLLDEITNTEENVVLQLDLLRNRILRFELFLSMSSFVVSWGALFTGLFGMNLLNHMESNKFTFYIISVGIFSGMGVLFLTAARYGRKERLF